MLLHRLTATILLTSLLTGCGVQALAPAPTLAPRPLSRAASAAMPDVARLVTELQAVTGFDAAAMRKRAELLALLGDTDDDRAVEAIQAEYDRLDRVPANARAP
ncbi:MAG: hypothetical protein VKP62_05290, partial [Candidatus Sericytochromatia bacterium]|nr:hypothetical protein [Candidatus Sericytochromatia bacterium]